MIKQRIIYIYIYLYIYIERDKEIQTGIGEGDEDIEFPGVLKKYYVEVVGVKGKRSAISRGDQSV